MSGVFELDPTGAQSLEDEAAKNPLNPADLPPPLWHGAGDQASRLMGASARAGRSATLLAAPFVMGAQANVNLARRVRGEQPDTDLTDWYFEHVTEGVGQRAVDHWTPDAAATGAAAQWLGTGFEVIGAVPQILGTPAMFLADAAGSPSVDAVQAGASTPAALGIGAVNLGANAVGMRLPAAWGQSLLTRVATGTGANVGVGAAANAGSAGIAALDGVDELVTAYDPLNPHALVIDGLLGAVFGARAHVELRDPVLAANNADHFANASLPGQPRTPDAAVRHQDHLATAIRQILNGEPVSVPARADDFDLRPELQARSTFDDAVEHVLAAEGGFVDDPVDRGGATNFGISSRANPDVDVRNLTREGAKAIYRERYWEPIGAEQLPAEIRDVAFDAAVNQGVGWTRDALKEAGGDVDRFVALREARYREIVAEDPSQAKFLRGWLNRLGRFRETTDAGRALRERLVTNPEQIAADYAARPDSDGGVILGTDIARELAPEYLADRTRSADVHEAASDVVKTLYDLALSKPTPKGRDNRVIVAAGGTGAGKTTGLREADLGRPELIYDTNSNRAASAIEKIDAALTAGRDVSVVYTFRDPVEALRQGALPRAMRQEAEFGSGRTVPLSEHAATHAGSAQAMRELATHYAANSRVEILAIDNSRGKGQARLVPLESLPHVKDNGLNEKLRAALDEARDQGEISEAVYRGFLADSSRAAARGGTRQADRGQPEPANRQGLTDGEVRETRPQASGAGADAAPRQAQAQPGGKEAGEAEAGLELRTAALEAIEAAPDLQILDENGIARSAADFMAEGDAEAAQAGDTARAVEAAANCFMRTAA